MIFARLILFFLSRHFISISNTDNRLSRGFEYFFHIYVCDCVCVFTYRHPKFIGHHANEDFIRKLCIHTHTHKGDISMSIGCFSVVVVVERCFSSAFFYFCQCQFSLCVIVTMLFGRVRTRARVLVRSFICT